MQPREVARAGTTVGQRTRTVSGGSPDAVPVIVMDRRADGRYLVRREHWPSAGDQPGTIAVPAVPSDAAIPYPCRAWLRFERGTLQGAHLYWPSPKSPRRLTNSVVAPTLTADWRCEHASFQRNNSYTAATFNFATAEPVTSLADLAGVASGILPRFYQGNRAWISPDYRVVNPEDEDYDSEIGEGDPYQLGPYLFQTIPTDPDFVYAHNLGAPGGLSYEISDWTTWAANHLCILDSGEIVLGWQEGESPTHYLAIFHSDGESGWRKVISLPGSTSLPIHLRDGADTVQVGDHLCTPVVNALTGAQYLHIWQISTDTEDAEVVELTGADSKGLVGAVWGNPEDTLPQSWVAGNLCIVQDVNGGLYAVNPTVTTAPAWIYAGTKRVRPLAVDGTKLVCAYEAATYQTVTDVFASTDYVDAGPTEEDRDILAEGKSTTGGLLYVFAASGAEISAAEFGGEEVNGTSLGPLLETRTTHEGPSYTSPAYHYDGLGYWKSGFPAAYIRCRPATWIGGGEPAPPGESEVYPYADSPIGNELYESIIVAVVDVVGEEGTDFYDDWLAKAEAYKEDLVRQFFEVMAARPSPAHFIKKEMWRLEWHSYSSIGNVHDNLHSIIEGPLESEPPETVDGDPAPSLTGPSTNYAGTEIAGIGETPGLPGWQTGMSPKTFGWDLVKVWSNVQEEYALTRTASPLHPLGPVCIAHGLIVHGPRGILDSGNDAHWVARRPSSPGEPEWTFTVANSTGLLVGNVWADSARFWIEYSTDGGLEYQLVGLLPATGEPDGGDPEIFIESGRVVFDGANLHDYFTEWAIGPG